MAVYPKLLFISALLSLAHAAEINIVESSKDIPLPKVKGRIDHLAYDAKTHRVFIAALGNNTVEIVDLEKQVHLQSLPGFDEPQGICFIDETRKLVVANGGDGSCRIFDGDSLKLEYNIDLKSDADNVHYDAATKRLYVGHGDGAIAIVDPGQGRVVGDIKVSAHPEGFAVDGVGKRIYVNVPNSKQIEVIDLDKQKVIDKWKLKDATGNFPMALDAEHHRLLVGCRSPAKLLLIMDVSGKIVSAEECPEDVDDVFFAVNGASCVAIGGDGIAKVFEIRDPEKVIRLGAVKTSKGARTGLLLDDQGCLLVVSPAAGEASAALKVLKLTPAFQTDDFRRTLDKIRKDYSQPLEPYKDEEQR